MAKKRPAKNDAAQFAELIRLPGTPESRQADHEQVQATVAENNRHVRSVIEKLLDVFRQRFKLPLTKGSDSQHTAALYVLHQAQHLRGTLLRIPRSQWRNGKFHECPPTYGGGIVAIENRDDFVQAMEYLRPMAAKLVSAANEVNGPSDLTTIPPDWIAGLEEAARLLSFPRKMPTCPADLQPTSFADVSRRESAKRIAPSLGPCPPSGEHSKAMTRFLKPFNHLPHHHQVWEYYRILTKIDAEQFPRWEAEAKAAGLELSDYVDKLVLPHMETFIALNGIPSPPADDDPPALNRHAKPRDDEPTEADRLIGRQVLAEMTTRNPSVESFRKAVRAKRHKASDTKLGKLFKFVKAKRQE